MHQKCGSERVNVLHKYIVIFMHENFENSKRLSERVDVKQLIMSYTKSQTVHSNYANVIHRTDSQLRSVHVAIKKCC